jgi:glycosyltransferase involved in cell wall biosynthesis
LGNPGCTRVAIVYPRATFDTVPSLLNAAELLARRELEVDVYTLVRADGSPRFANPRIHVRSLGTEVAPPSAPTTLRSLVDRAGWVGRTVRRPLAHGYQAVRAAAAPRRVARPATPADMDEPRDATVCFIGVDPDGLELAHELARGTGASLGYYSLELLLSSDLVTDADRRAKQVERELSRQAAFVVVQDAARARLLADDNGLDERRLVLVPNAPLGRARRRPSGYWHHRFELGPERKVLLHAGSLGAWTGIDQVVTTASTWPDDWALVVHTRYDASSSEYVRALRARAAPGRVFWSLKPVSSDAYEALVDGADAALALYLRSEESVLTGRNVETIGLSSGKLAYALRAGVPVIVNRSTSIASLIQQEGCGVLVDEPGDVGNVLPAIAQRHEQLAERACAFFERYLQVEPAFEEVIRRLPLGAMPAV